MTKIVAELTTSGERIVLVAGGSAIDEIAEAARRLQMLTPLFTKSDPPGALVTPATWPTVVQLRAAFGDHFAPGPALRAWITEQARVRTAPLPASLTHTPPEGLVPRPYQVDGAQEIARTGRCLIFDEPRTGKTITTILGLLERRAAGDVGPALVVCPASVVDPWVEEFGRWAPHLTTVAWRGPRRRALAGRAEVYVTSYDTARIDTPPGDSKRGHPLLDLGARTLVLDETHLAKNPHAERTKSVQRLAKDVDTFVGLSGTPITHHPGDLWPALTCLAPGAWPARERWVYHFCDVLPDEYDEQVLGLNPHTEPEFRLTILGQHRRVARADVMSQLPPKTYSVRTVEVPKAWRKAYDDMESQMLAELPDGQELSVMSVLAQMTRLSQLASAAAEVETRIEIDEDGEERPHVSVTLKEPSWKVDALLEVLEERPDEQVVVFAPSRQLIMLAGQACEKAGYDVGYIVGGQSQTERTRVRTGFQSGQIKIVCATTGAGGTGITLSAAGTLVFLQRPWSLVESVQAEDRGEGDLDATRGTEVIDIVARNTIDTRVRAVLRERAGQLSDLVQDPRIVAELLGGTTRTKETA